MTYIRLPSALIFSATLLILLSAVCHADKTDFSGHWLKPHLLVIAKIEANVHYSLVTQPINTEDKDEILPLTSTTFPKDIKNSFPHLRNYQAFKLDISANKAKKWLKQKLLVIGRNYQGQVVSRAYLQTGAVLDALYTQGENDADEVKSLGATVLNNTNAKDAKDKNKLGGVSFKLWAPTAQSVELLLFNQDKTPAKTPDVLMIEDSHSGIWQVNVSGDYQHSYYQYRIKVYHPASKQVETLISTDPYSLSLSINSQYSQVIDLDNMATQPKNWKNHNIPTVKNIEDNVFYETHIRDFSSNDKLLSDQKFRGKYKAFSEQNSSGINHLKALKQAGLNNIHLLPTFDIATVNEDTNQVIDLSDTMAKVCRIVTDVQVCKEPFDKKQTLKNVLASYDVNSKQVQQRVSDLRAFDNYNWGYDPYHYTVPEGSYAINPEGSARIVEFREMVQSLHRLGFRVIMDVVYNHTHQSGLEPNAVLDKIVPNYYHRLDPITGAIEQSTCCDNTATERVMMAKLMTDSLVVWAQDYKIDGFRFDLMGHQPKSAMLTARAAVRKVDADTYFYGEGWNFGEVANNQQFTQASQLELGGSEIGTYTDRLRDAVRGPGNNTRQTQGIGNGLLMQPNELQTPAQSKKHYQLLADQLRIGLAGNLANFALLNSEGKKVFGKDIPYGNQPTGYALDPADTINYVSKHDNQTLWDNSQYRLDFKLSSDDRVRMHLQSLSFVFYAQGIPFLHMGSEFMRSKSFLRDSYDYGDWFNRVDFTKQENFYNIGLPPAEKDQENWPLIQQVLKKNQGRDQVTSEQINFSSNVFTEMLAIRMNSALFRLTNAQQIIDKVSFLNTGKNQQLGLLVMKIDDRQGQPVDDKVAALIVIFNTSDKKQFFAHAEADKYQLDLLQQNSADATVKTSKANKTGFIVPALTTAVFVLNK